MRDSRKGGLMGAGADSAAGKLVGAARRVGEGAAVTRGVTAGVGTAEAAGVVMTLERGATSRPAFRTPSASREATTINNSTVPNTCQPARRKRRPVETKGRPHQSHSRASGGLRPPQPAQLINWEGGAGKAVTGVSRPPTEP